MFGAGRSTVQEEIRMRAMLVGLLLLTAGCTPRWCDRVAATRARLLPSGACTDTSTGTSRALVLFGAECRDTSACTATDEAALDDYVRCLNLQQPCREANERVTVEGVARCADVFRAALSASCRAALE